MSLLGHRWLSCTFVSISPAGAKIITLKPMVRCLPGDWLRAKSRINDRTGQWPLDPLYGRASVTKRLPLVAQRQRALSSVVVGAIETGEGPDAMTGACDTRRRP